MEDFVSVELAFILGFMLGALVYSIRRPRHCALNRKECIKTRARLQMWAKRYKRKTEALNDKMA